MRHLVLSIVTAVLIIPPAVRAFGGEVVSAAVVSPVGRRIERPIENALGSTHTRLVAFEQAVSLQSPAGDGLTGCIMAVFDPQRRLFWWSYQSTDGSDVPEGGWLSWWLDAGAIYADKERVARFSTVSGRGFWFRESTDTVDSIDEGFARAVTMIERMAHEFFGAGGWYLLHQEIVLYPILTSTEQEFFILPGHAEALPNARVIDIQRTQSEWVLTLQGSNPEHRHARVHVRHDGSPKSFALMKNE